LLGGFRGGYTRGLRFSSGLGGRGPAFVPIVNALADGVPPGRSDHPTDDTPEGAISFVDDGPGSGSGPASDHGTFRLRTPTARAAFADLLSGDGPEGTAHERPDDGVLFMN
jgi:hypothetical protein